MSSKPSYVNPESLPTFGPTYSQYSVTPLSSTSRIVSFSGQVGWDPFTGQVPSTPSEQVAFALSNLDKCLRDAKVEKSDIIQVRQYIVGMGKRSPEERKEMLKPYSEFMGGLAPPMAFIGVEALALPQLIFEIEVVAVVNK